MTGPRGIADFRFLQARDVGTLPRRRRGAEVGHSSSSPRLCVSAGNRSRACGGSRRRRSGALPFCLRGLRVLRARPAGACRAVSPQAGKSHDFRYSNAATPFPTETRTATRFRLAAQAWTRRGLAWEPRRPTRFPPRTPPGSRPLRRPVPAPPPDGPPPGFAAHRHRGRSTSKGSARGARHPWAAGRKPVGLVRVLSALCSALHPFRISVSSAVPDIPPPPPPTALIRKTAAFFLKNSLIRLKKGLPSPNPRSLCPPTKLVPPANLPESPAHQDGYLPESASFSGTSRLLHARNRQFPGHLKIAPRTKPPVSRAP